MKNIFILFGVFAVLGLLYFGHLKISISHYKPHSLEVIPDGGKND